MIARSAIVASVTDVALFLGRRDLLRIGRLDACTTSAAGVPAVFSARRISETHAGDQRERPAASREIVQVKYRMPLAILELRQSPETYPRGEALLVDDH